MFKAIEQILNSDENNKTYVISSIKENEVEFRNNHLRVTELVTEKADILKVIIRLNEEIYRRLNTKDISKFGRIRVVIYELNYITRATELEKEKSVPNDISKELDILARLGRKAKVSLVIERPSS